MLSYILAVVSAVLLLGADQLTKYLVSAGFTLGERREFLNGFIDLTYIHNRGGAWGLLYGKTYILIPITVIVMAVCIILYKKHGKKNKLLFWAIMLVLSGGVGNMIDRLASGSVTDMICFDFVDFPIFNVADIFITVGCAALVLCVLISDGKKKPRKDTANDTDG